MKDNNNQKVELRPRLVTNITISFLIIATIVLSIVIINNNSIRRNLVEEKNEEDIKSQIIEQNMKIGEAEEGILIGSDGNAVLGGVTIVKGIAGVNEVVGATGGTGTDTTNWDLTKVDIVLDTEGISVPVPKGFTASGADGEHTVRTGFVIYEGTGEVNNTNAWDESKARNQFVWVPVYDTSRVYETNSTTGKKKAKLWNFTATGRTAVSNTDTDTRREPGVLSSQGYDNIRYLSRMNLQGKTKVTFYKELETQFDLAMESIEKYGGFYIGRYETGNVSSQTPVVRRMNTTISNQTWYNMYNRMKNISQNENIQTSMIWGCLWDETLQWLIDTEAKTQAEIATDSSEWGNYNNVTFEYTQTNGTIATKATGVTRIATGSTERNKANNIYDMAGNVWDWTLEGGGSAGRYFRGGCYGVTGTIYPARNRDGYYPSSSLDNRRFPRVLLHQIGRRYVDKATYLPDPLNSDGDTL